MHIYVRIDSSYTNEEEEEKTRGREKKSERTRDAIQFHWAHLRKRQQEGERMEETCLLGLT